VLCDVRVFPLKVALQQVDWPEKQQSRIWVSHREAAKLVKKPGLRQAIRDFSSPR
jgi:hypothetical protein